MKTSYFLLLSACVLLEAGCSNDDIGLSGKKVTSISFAGDVETSASSSNSGLRTTTSEATVTWKTGDAIGIMKTTDPTSNRHFILSSISATDAHVAVFNAVTDADGLEDGTYVACYPYDDKFGRYTYDNFVVLSSLTQPDETNSHLATTDLLYSDPFTVSNGEISGNVIMHHALTLLEVNLKVAGTAITSAVSPRLTGLAVRNHSSGSASDSTMFASRAYFDDSAGLQFLYNLVTVSFSHATVLTSSYQTFWITFRQNPAKIGNIDLWTAMSLYTSGGSQINAKQDISYTINLSKALEARKRYVMYMTLYVNSAKDVTQWYVVRDS